MRGDDSELSRTRPGRPAGRARSLSRTLTRAGLLLGLAAWLAAAASLDIGHVGVVLDDGIYLVAARALRDGQGYCLPSRPGDPPPKYPIGLPATIALGLGAVRGEASGPTGSLARDVAVARAVVVASGLAYLLAAFGWLRRVGAGPAAALLVVLAAGFHHVALIGCASTIFSDLPFAAVTYVLLGRWAGRSDEADPGAGAAGWRSLVDGGLAGYGYMLRGNGLTLVVAAAAAAWLAPRRRSGLAGLAVGLALAVAPLSLMARGAERLVPSGDYRLEMEAGWSSPAAGARIVAANLRSVALEFPLRVLAPNASYTAPLVRWLDAHPMAEAAVQVAASGVVGLGVAALWRKTRRRDLPAWIHAAGTVAIFAVWPWNSILDRFLLGLMPMVVLAFGVGLSTLGRWAGLGVRSRRRLALLGLILAAAGSLSVAARAVSLFHADGRQWRGASHRLSLDEALAGIREETEPDAVIAATWPEAVALATGRQVVPLIEDDDVLTRRYGRRDRLALWMAQVPGRPFYLLVRSESEDPDRVDLRQAEAVASSPELALRPAFRTGDGRYALLRVVPRGSPKS